MSPHPKPRLCEGGCGRWLRTPESIALRFGPVCWEKANPRTGRGHSHPRIATRRLPVASGQLTLFEETTMPTPRQPIWTYHVAYATPTGFGDIEMFFNQVITTREHVNAIRAEIARANELESPQITVISFQLLQGPASAQAEISKPTNPALVETGEIRRV